MTTHRIMLGLLASTLLASGLAGCAPGGSTHTTDIGVIATTDLHGAVTFDIATFIEQEREADPQVTLVDAGDFFDSDSMGAMEEYFALRRGDEEQGTKTVRKIPIVRQLRDAGYDAVTLGNHEFVANDKSGLDDMIDQFAAEGVAVLSANTYEADGTNYVSPYVIKEIDTPEGPVRLGILGLTIKEVGESDGTQGTEKSRELKDMAGYDGELFMHDLVEDASKWVDVMKSTEQTDVILAVVHSGEKPKNPEHPGNRIQELAQDVPGIDAIVAGHTHKIFEQHDYRNTDGNDVLVTQPGSHGEAASKITFELERADGSWRIVDKKANLTEFPENTSEGNLEGFLGAVYTLDEDADTMSWGDSLPFEWDVAYTFGPNATRQERYEAVGYRWMDLAETSTDDLFEIVFMKGGKVVCYLRAEEILLGLDFAFKETDFAANTLKIVPGENDSFTVDHLTEGQSPEGYHMRLTQQ